MYQIKRGDCLELMKSINDKSVDMILADLPYGTTACSWDTIIPFEPLWDNYKRIIKPNGCIALFSSQPFTTKLILSNEKDFKYCWYWVKNQGTNFFHANDMPIRKIEEICIFGKCVYYPQVSFGHIPTNTAKGCSNGKIYYGSNKRDYKGGNTTRLPTNILDFKCVDNYTKVHSSEKPVPLLSYLIKTYTLENETVLDNTMGSGSTGVACIRTNRNFIGFELDENYFSIAEKRILEEIDKTSLFNNVMGGGNKKSA